MSTQYDQRIEELCIEAAREFLSHPVTFRDVVFPAMATLATELQAEHENRLHEALSNAQKALDIIVSSKDREIARLRKALTQIATDERCNSLQSNPNWNPRCIANDALSPNHEVKASV